MTEEQQSLTIIVRATRYGREADNQNFVQNVHNELLMRFGENVIQSVTLTDGPA